MYEVVYMVNNTGERITKEFNNLREALKLKYKLEHSVKCTLISFMDYGYNN